MNGWSSWAGVGEVRCARCAASMCGGERHVCHVYQPSSTPQRQREEKAVSKTSTSPIARDVMYRNHVKSLSSYSYSSTASSASSSSLSPSPDLDETGRAGGLQTVPEIPEWSQRRGSSCQGSPLARGVRCGTCGGLIRVAGCVCVAEGRQPNAVRAPPVAKAGRTEPSTSPTTSPVGGRITPLLEDESISRHGASILARPSCSSATDDTEVRSPAPASARGSVSVPSSPGSYSALPNRPRCRDETPAGRRICSPSSPAGRRIDASPAQRSPSAVDAAVVPRASSEPSFEPARPAHPFRRPENAADWRTVVARFTRMQNGASKRDDSPGSEPASTVADAMADAKPLDGCDDCDDIGGGHWSMSYRAVPRQNHRSHTRASPPRPVAVQRVQHNVDAPVWQNDAYPVREQARERLQMPLFLRGLRGSSS